MHTPGGFMNFAVILAGGIGTRMGQATPKQYLEVEGKPVLMYTLEKFQACDAIHQIVIVADMVWHEQIRQWLDQYGITKFLGFAEPGVSRQDSVYSGLCYCRPYAQSEEDIVLIHEAARALVSQRLIHKIIDGLAGYDACIPVIPMNDSILFSKTGDTIDGLLDRSTMFRGQAPESFRLIPYYELNRKTPPTELSSYRADHELCFQKKWKVHCIPGEDNNFKLTTPGDIDQMITLIQSGKLK